jgi:hypothetical protein
LVLILALFDLLNYDSAFSAADKRFIATVCFIIIQPISHYLVQTDLMGIYRSRGFPYCRLAMLHFYPDCQKTNLKIDSSCFRSIMKPPHNTYNLHSLVHHLFLCLVDNSNDLQIASCNPNWNVRFKRKIPL